MIQKDTCAASMFTIAVFTIARTCPLTDEWIKMWSIMKCLNESYMLFNVNYLRCLLGASKSTIYLSSFFLFPFLDFEYLSKDT